MSNGDRRADPPHRLACDAPAAVPREQPLSNRGTTLGDYLNLAAAILGGALGLFVMFRLGVVRNRGEGREPVAPEPVAPEPTVLTHHASAQPSSVAPILTALGLSLLGVGLAIGSHLEAFGLLPLVAGVALLAGALMAALRGRST